MERRPYRRLFLPAVVLFTASCVGCGPFLPDGQRRTIRSGGDLVAYGSSAIATDSVPGDVMMAARIVDFSGKGDGAFLGAGEEVRMMGRIAGSTMGAGGLVLLDGHVGRNLLAAGGAVRIRPNGSVARNAYLAGGRVEVDGVVEGSVRIAAREAILNGPIAGDVDVMAGTLELGPLARIEGNLTYRVEEDGVVWDAAASVEGEVTEIRTPPPSPLPGFFFRMLRLLGFLLLGAMAVLVFGGTIGRWSWTMRGRPLPALGHGLLWLLLVPLLVFATFVTVVGIPLAATAALLYGVALYVGPVVPALALGRRLLGHHEPAGRTGWGSRQAGRPNGRGRDVGAFLLGGSILGILLLIPWIGWPLRMIVTGLGFGAAVLTVRDGAEE